MKSQLGRYCLARGGHPAAGAIKRARSLLKLCSTRNRADMPTAAVLAVSAPRVAQRAKRAIAKPAALRRSTRSCAQGRAAAFVPKVRRVSLRFYETSD